MNRMRITDLELLANNLYCSGVILLAARNTMGLPAEAIVAVTAAMVAWCGVCAHLWLAPPNELGRAS